MSKALSEFLAPIPAGPPKRGKRNSKLGERIFHGLDHPEKVYNAMDEREYTQHRPAATRNKRKVKIDPAKKMRENLSLFHGVTLNSIPVK